MIDRYIYHLQHYLVEMIARCTSQLYVVLLQNSESLKTVTDVWKNELVDQWKIETTEDTFRENSVYTERLENPKIIRGIFSSDKYKNLEDAFSDSSTSDNEVNAAKNERIAMEVIHKKR